MSSEQSNTDTFSSTSTISTSSTSSTSMIVTSLIAAFVSALWSALNLVLT